MLAHRKRKGQAGQGCPEKALQRSRLDHVLLPTLSSSFLGLAHRILNINHKKGTTYGPIVSTTHLPA